MSKQTKKKEKKKKKKKAVPTSVIFFLRITLSNIPLPSKALLAIYVTLMLSFPTALVLLKILLPKVHLTSLLLKATIATSLPKG